MNFLYNLKVVISLIIVQNFFYKYYIGANFFTELHKNELAKEKIAKDFFILLSMGTVILYLQKLVYGYFFDNESAYLILLILASYFSILIYEKILGNLTNRLYFAVNIFLLLSIIENQFDNHLAKAIAIVLIPLFYYFNLVVLEPLLKTLKYKKRPVYVKEEALIIIVIAIVGLLLSAFETI